MSATITIILRELRPLQWIKSAFILLPVFFSGQGFQTAALQQSLLAAALFSLGASGLYIINDIVDREADRRHPVKRFRPIASGALSLPLAVVLAIVLTAGSLIGAFLQSSTFGMILALYVVVTLSYSFGLKRIVIFDTMMIVVGFLLRVMAGGAVIQVHISEWLFITVAFAALFLALLKRHAELVSQPEGGRREVLQRYTPLVLQQMISVALTGSILSYALYTFSRADADALRWSTLLVMYALFRYLAVAMRDGHGEEPERFILRDRPLLLSLLLFALYLFTVVYVVP